MNFPTLPTQAPIRFEASTKGRLLGSRTLSFEKVASETPEKIITNKINFKSNIEMDEIEKIIKPFNFNNEQKLIAQKLIKAIYKILIEKDATLIEINPLIVTKDERVVCLDAKMNFDDKIVSFVDKICILAVTASMDFSLPEILNIQLQMKLKVEWFVTNSIQISITPILNRK